jgi:hypothetical protein
VNDMSWAPALILCGIVFIAIAWAYCYVASRSDKFISNRDINEHKITPRFDVGSDIK